MRKNKLITVIGNIASGKSTLTNLLAKHLPAVKLDLDKFYSKNPFFPSALKDRKRWSFTSDLWFLNERVNAAKTYPLLLKKGSVVVDSGIPMSFIWAKSKLFYGSLLDTEWSLYQKLFKLLTVSLKDVDIVIRLSASPTYLFQQIKKRNRSFELRYYDTHYLKNIELSIRDYMKSIHDKKKVLIINREKNDFLHDRKALAQLLKKITP